MNRRRFLKYSALTAVGAVIGVPVYTFEVEPHWVRVRPRDLRIEGLPRALDGARMVQISDLHCGPQVSDAYLSASLTRVAALRPDILVITGDLISYRVERREDQFTQLRGVLSHLAPARLATLSILGNHDYGRGWREDAVAARVVTELERAGVRVLRNACANVQGLDIIGFDDIWSGHADAALALAQRTSNAAIVLSHNPDSADELKWRDYRGWILSGHTHGGQCKPPFLPPPLLPVRNKRYVAGEVPLADGRRLYINRGLGHLLKVRFNVRPEISVFTLRA
jgi:hypothetical protein